MKNKKLLILLILSIFLTTSPNLTQGFDGSDSSRNNPKKQQKTKSDINQDQGINCFDYYKFQSVQISLGLLKNSHIPGEHLFFQGTLENKNDYPIVDGYLLARISQENGNFTNEGHKIYEEFIPLEKIILDSKETKEIEFNREILKGIPAGDYRVDFFFSVGKKFNLAGLPFTNEVIGSFTKFKIENGAETQISILRDKTTVNGEKYNHIGAWPNLEINSKAEIIQPIKNNTNNNQNLEIAYDLYKWDSLNEEDKIDSKKETIVVEPNQTKELTYTIKKIQEAVYLLRITTNNNEGQKSITNIRVTTEGESPRINFPGMTKFPLKKGEPTTLFSCLHNTSGLNTSGKLILTLEDENNKVIEKLEYLGDITSAMDAQKKDFTPKRDYNQVTLKAQLLDKNNQEIDTYQTTYACNEINPEKCSQDILASDLETETILPTKKIKNNTNDLLIPIAAILFLMLVVFIFVVVINEKGKKKRRRK